MLFMETILEDVSSTVKPSAYCPELPPPCQFITTTLRYASPSAFANLQGCPAHPEIRGLVLFYDLSDAVLVQASVEGLPCSTASCQNHFFAFHLHSGTSCAGTERDPFSLAKGHYNPEDCPHPSHAGDFPPLLCSHGIAWSAFLTDRFSIDEIVKRTVILHEGVDDFTSQPAGNAGAKIACGVIYKVEEP